MSREIRAVRPFDSLDDAQRRMRDGVQIVAFAAARSVDDLANARDGQALRVARDVYLYEQFELFLFRHPVENADFVEAAAKEIRSMFRFDPSIVHLVVQVHNKRLRMTDVVFDQPLVGGEIPLSIVLAEKDRTGTAPRPRAFMTPDDGCEVVVELLLAAEVPEEHRSAGIAWRKGSWLARTAIRVTTGPAGGGPAPRPLDADVRERHQVPANAQHYVRRVATGESILRKASFDECVEFYVEESVLRGVVEDPNTPMSVLLQYRWILMCADAVLAMAVAEEEFSDFDPVGEHKESLVRTILDRVVDGHSVRDVTAALDLLKQDRGLFIAMLEDRAGLMTRERALLGLEV